MHVVQIIDDLNVGGAQQTLVTFATELDYNIHKLSIISLTDAAPLRSELEALGSQVYVLSSKKLISPAFIVQLSKLLRTLKPDTLQSHLLYANVIGGLASWLARVPSAATLHARDDHPRYRDSPKRRIETFVLKYCHQKWIAIANDVAKSHRGRLPGNRMVVVENAVSLTETATDKEHTREQIFGFAKNSVGAAWICVSRLVDIKGIPDLLNAFATALIQRPEDRLIIVGTGPAENKIQTHITKLGLQERVAMLGHRRDVRELLSSADIFVSAAHSEGLPISLLEAMASALPIVHTNVGEVGKLIDESCGALVPPQDPVEFTRAAVKILSRPDRATLGDAAKKVVTARYDGNRWVTTLLKELDFQSAR